MLEFLSQNLLWWHWIMFGILLLTAEIFSGVFLMLGLGVAAILVGVIDVIFSMGLKAELTSWMVLSLTALFVWFKYLHDKTVDKSGQSDYALEAEGIVEESVFANGRGKVKFDLPVLGNTKWHATSKKDIAAGSRVKIVQIKGQLIEVAEI